MVILALWGRPTLAWAQTVGPQAASAPEVEVDCPELGAEQRAAVEARQMSELVSQGGASGTLRLVCSPDRVSGTWSEGVAVLESRSLSRNEGEDAVELLHWVASVLLEMRRERQASTSAIPAVVAAAAPIAATAADPAAAPPQPDSQANQVPEPAIEEAEPSPTSVAEPPPPSPPKRWQFGIAAAYAHFGTEIAGTLGPRVTVSRRLIERVHLTLAVDLKAGLGTSAGFGVLDVSAALGATVDIVPFLSATAAPLLVVSTFSAPEGAASPSATTVAGGLLASVRAKLPWQPARPFLDLGVLAATPARQVTFTDGPVLTVPEWQALLAVGGELSL